MRQRRSYRQATDSQMIISSSIDCPEKKVLNGIYKEMGTEMAK
jgi:hypothetical protein